MEGARLDSKYTPLPSVHLQQEQVALIGLRAAKIDCTALLACLVSVFADPRWEPEICTRAHLQDSAVLVHRLPEHSAVRGRPLAHPAHLVAEARLVPRLPRPSARLRQLLPLGGAEHLAPTPGVPLEGGLAPAILGAPLASLLQVVLVQPLGLLALQQGVRLVHTAAATASK